MKELITEALYEAGKILMNNFGKISGYEIKESQSSIVTQADLESEKKIISLIVNKFPEHNTIGEETGFRNNKSEFTWIIDPLDGTSNFAAGLPWFGVIICVLKNSKPVLAGCYLPVLNELYLAEKGLGATCNGKAISVSKETSLKNVLVSYSLDYSRDPAKTRTEARIIGKVVQHTRNLRATNSITDYCYTADGRMGACINQTSKIWDIAGPALLIEEAGGIATEINGKPFSFETSESDYLRNFTFIGAKPEFHRQLTELIKPAIKPVFRIKLMPRF